MRISEETAVEKCEGGGGQVSTNVYLRRIHNHALGMEWRLKSAILRLQSPKKLQFFLVKFIESFPIAATSKAR